MNSLPQDKREQPVSHLPRDDHTVLFLITADSRITMKEIFNKFDEKNQRRQKESILQRPILAISSNKKQKGRISGLFCYAQPVT
ncbi:ABC transporter ATP-binding protein [Rahnella aceris]